MQLDNEASPQLQQEIQAKDIDFQLFPPEMHICYVAERAIRIFKDHFIPGL